jgi:hypothetical protein
MGTTAISNADWADPRSAALLKIAGLSALLAAGCCILQIVIEIIGVGFMRIAVPTDILGWYTLLQRYPLLGLTELTAFQIPAFALFVPLFIGLYGILRRHKRSPAAIASLFAFIGIAVYLASNTALSLLHLSSKYVAAANEAQKSIILAAGEAMLAIYEGIGVDVGLFLFMIAVLIVSTLAFQTRFLGNGIGWAGMLAALLTLAYYACSAFTAQAIFILEAAGVFLVIWLVLVGLSLLRLQVQGAEGDPE